MQSDREENLRTQLCQLNERARWYGQQYWQVSLAYVASASIAFVQAIEAKTENSWLIVGVSMAAGIAGVFLIFHLDVVEKNMKRCVDGIIDTEKLLGLRWRSPDRDNATQAISPVSLNEDHHVPLRWLVLLLLSFFLLFGFYGIAFRLFSVTASLR